MPEKHHLPENAYRKLKEGESYIPVLSPDKKYKETTLYSVGLGFLFTIIFTMALMYLALKLGQGISADTPVAIIGVGLALLLKKKEPLGENIIMQYIPYTASAVMIAATFVMPAFYILEIPVSYLDCLITIILGGILGTFVSVIFRRYFVEDMHGDYPFPGSFATSEILVTSKGSSARVMIISGFIGLIYDFITGSVGWWNEVFTTKAFSWGKNIAAKYKLVYSLDVSAAFLGLGFLTGFKYSSIITAGAVFGGFVCVPLIGIAVGHGKTSFIGLTPDEIYSSYVKAIGVGALATAGVIGLLKMMKVISKAIIKALKDIFTPSKHQEKLNRAQTDLHMKTVVIGIVTTLVLIGIFIYIRVANQSLKVTAMSLLIVIVFSFLFSIIAATSIAYTSNEPVSGMTILMMVVSAVAFTFISVDGTRAAFIILIVASIVCTMLGQSGYVAGAYKLGFLLGATPKKLQIWGIISIIFSTPIILLAFIILHNAYGFVGPNALAAPQGNAMASILRPLLSGAETPWMFYIIGAFIAIGITMCGIEALPFAMGIYLPMPLAMPFFAGGVLSWFISTRSKDEDVNFARKSKGTIIAAGLIAGGAIAGIISAILQIFGVSFINEAWLKTDNSRIAGLIALLALSIFVIIFSKARKEES